MRYLLHLLKLIGIAVFVGIVIHLDERAILEFLREADTLLVALGFAALWGVLAVKSLRWHLLVRAAPHSERHRFGASWREFMIGVFLSTFTPAKLGDFGKIAYLRKDGVSAKTGALLVVMEKVADVPVLLLIGILGASVIFGPKGFVLSILCLALGSTLIALSSRISVTIASAVRYVARHHALVNVMMLTIMGWTFHYVWAIAVARATGITISLPVLIAALTGASLLNALPISPSGLGTRDAALLAVLTPYGIEGERIIAFTSIMFVELLLVAVPGGVYWLRRGPAKGPHISTIDEDAIAKLPQ